MDLVEQIERKLKHAKRRLDYFTTKYDQIGEENLTYHGGWNTGYWQSKVSTYEEILDLLESGD